MLETSVNPIAAVKAFIAQPLWHCCLMRAELCVHIEQENNKQLWKFFSAPTHGVSVQLMSPSKLAKLITTNLTRMLQCDWNKGHPVPSTPHSLCLHPKSVANVVAEPLKLCLFFSRILLSTLNLVAHDRGNNSQSRYMAVKCWFGKTQLVCALQGIIMILTKNGK